MTTGAFTPLEIGVVAVLFAVALWLCFENWRRRPLTDTDRYCGQLDDEWTAIERHGIRPSDGVPTARAHLTGDGAVVISFPRRLRLVSDALDETGCGADIVDFDWHGGSAA